MNFIFKHINCLIFTILLLGVGPIYSQQLTEIEKTVNQAMEDGDYFLACDLLKDYPIKDSANNSIDYKLAEAFRLSNNYSAASYWYSYVLIHDTTAIFPQCSFWYALMLKSQASYDSASQYFSYYLNSHCKEKDWYCLKSENEIHACSLAKQRIQNAKPIKITHLEQEVNSPYSEFGALQLGDSILLFSSLQQITTNEYGSMFPSVYLSKIWSSNLSMAGLTKRKEWDHKINNSKYHTANITFNKNNTLMLYTQCVNGKNGKLICEIFCCEKKGNEWQTPFRLGNNINVKGYTSTQPCFVQTDEGTEVLYFVSDRKGGIGGNDIWYSIFKNNHFYEPANAGNTINTLGDEITPFYHSKSQTLYFSSDWHSGMGGFDIFRSKGGLNAWSPPENMGYPLNTSCNELYFVVNNSDTDGYFTSNRQGSYHIKGETCCNDIYTWEKTLEKHDSLIVKTDTLTYKSAIRKLLPITLFFHNDEPDPSNMNTSTQKTYLQTVQNYLSMKALYKTEYSKGLIGNEKTESLNQIDNFFTNYIEKGKNQLDTFLTLLTKDLEKGTQVAITIKGFTSPLNNNDYNLNLSKRRISSFLNYIKGYAKGSLNSYLDSTATLPAKLKIFEEPLGKTKANPKVSDNPNDIRNSIYSPEAAMERKIQILYYDTFSNRSTDTILPTSIIFDQKEYNIGKIIEGEQKVVIFSFKNTGNHPLYIENIKSDCDCFSFNFPSEKIMPGQKSHINVLFKAPSIEGNVTKTISITSNSKDIPLLLIEAQISKKPGTAPVTKKKTK